MTAHSARTQTLGFLIVIGGLTLNYWTTPVPITLQAEPIAAGERCYRCERTITDRAIAAEGLTADRSTVRKFKTIACMTKYLRDSGEDLEILVTDYPSGRLTQARWATFVRSAITPAGDVDYVAFRNAVDGRSYANRTGAEPLDWDFVQASERQNPLIR